MKKTIYSLMLLMAVFFFGKMHAQTLSFTVTPPSQCYTSSNTGTAGVTIQSPSVAAYYWSISSPSCNATYTSLSSGTNSRISIYYPCCGTYTINCYAYSSNSVVIASTSQTAVISCNSPVTVWGSSVICAGSSAYLYATGATNYTWQPGNLNGDSVVVTPSVTTCYTVTGSNNSGCTSTFVKCITVQSSSVSITGNANICSGSYAVLYGSGATNYTWMPGNLTTSSIAVTPSANICYTLMGSGCNSGLSYAYKCVTVNPTPVISTSGNTITCPFQSTTIFLSGASAYSIVPSIAVSVSGSTAIFSPSATTCYSIIGTNSYGCTGYKGICINVANPSITVNGNSTICGGSSTILYASSSASSYTWMPGNITGDSIAVTPSVSTCYTVWGSFGPGCFNTAVKCVSVQPGSSVSISGGNNAICSGSYAILYASGASNYTWYPGGSTSSSIIVTPTAPACYTLQGYGCNGLSSAVRCISVAPSPVLSVSGNTSVCGMNGATLTASGASTYSWMYGSSTFTGSTVVLTPSASTCFSLIGMNASGCYGVSGVCINVQSGLNMSISGNGNICAGSGATLTASGAQNYTWYPGGYTGATVVLSPSVSTCYTAVGTSTSSGCSGSAVKCVNIQTLSSVSIGGPGNICSGSSGNILVGFGATNYTWYPGGSNSASIAINPTATACYTLLGSGGCYSGVTSAVHCVSIIPTPVLSISGNTTICLGTGATLTASGATTYTWMYGSSTFTGSTIVLTPSASTCFSLIGSTPAPQGCLGYSGACINVQGSNLSISGNSSICGGSSTTLTASGAQTYTWQPGGQVGSSIVVSPSVSTCYTVAGYIQACGINYATKCVQIGTPPTITSYPSATLCAGQPASFMASGATSYTWLPFNLTGSFVTVTATTPVVCYTVIGTNSSGCTGSSSNCYSVFPTASISISGANVNCSGQSTTLTASGATNYYWQPGGLSGSSIVVSPTANVCYTVTGYSSGQMCPGTAVRCMSVSPAPQLNVSGNTNVCAGSSAVLSASGAQSYTWIPGNLTGSTIAVSPSVSTCYTVVGTNGTGCVGVNNICITIKPKPTIYTSSGFFCAGQSDSLSAFGASTYTWLPFNLTGQHIVITPSVSGCYTVIGTNSVGCTNTATSCYSVMPSPVITISGSGSVCAGGSTSLIASGGASYIWAPGGMSGSGIVVSPSVNTCYTVYANNGFGCAGNAVKCVTVQQGASVSISGNNLICAGSSANLLASGANSYTWSNGSNSPVLTVSPTSPTCYTVIGKTTQGCIGSAVKCISVQAVPVISVSGNTNICQGNASTLVATGASSYSWNTGSSSSNIVVTPSTSVVYVVTGSNGICSGTKSISVTVRPKPFVYINGGDSIICGGDSIILYASGANSYTWNTGFTASWLPISPSVTTAYSVVGTSTNGCTNAAAKIIHVTLCTGIEKNAVGSMEISIYPNPSSRKITISVDGNSKVHYMVYDMIGREIVQGEFTNTKVVDLSNYAHGSYIIRFESGTKTSYKKLIIE